MPCGVVTESSQTFHEEYGIALDIAGGMFRGSNFPQAGTNEWAAHPASDQTLKMGKTIHHGILLPGSVV